MIKKLNLVFVMIFLAVGNHVVKAQRNIGPPSLASAPQACGKPGSGFDFVAELSPGVALPDGNEFVLQLSDPTGSFLNEDDITELIRVPGLNDAAGGPQDIIFPDVAVPTDANSDNYRVRVIASLVENIVSQLSEPIPFHFFDDDNVLIRLNSNDDVTFCNVSSFAKEVAVVVTDNNNNELDVNDFNWEWTRNGVVIPGANDPTLLITEVGEYQARVPVGLCINFFPFSVSNTIDAILLDDSDITITTSAPDFSFCPDDLKVLTASDGDPRYNFQWIKDGEELENQIASSIVLPDNDFGGTYTLRVEISEDCTLITNPVVVTNEGSSITMPLPESLILLPTQVLTLVVETDAPIGSTFRWIRDTNVQIQGTTTGSTLTFDVPANGVGDYRIEIDALFPDDACMTMLFSETIIRAAESFILNIAADEVIDCDQDPITIALDEFLGRTVPNQLLVPLTAEQFDFFDFEWFKDGVPTGETSLSLDVSSSDNGGVFQLVAMFRPGGLPDTGSNELAIDFLPSNITLDITPPVLEEGQSVVLTAPLNANYTYEWYVIQNGEEVLIEGESGNTLTVTEEGSYFARISTLLCTTDTLTAQVGGPAALSELIPNVITPNGDNTNDVWVLPNSFRESDVEVKIYTAMGKLEFEKSGGYNGEWPADSQTQGNELIYYYIIARNSTVVKKGTITVMR